MITPSYGLTVTERVLPRLALDWTTGVAQTGVDVTRAGVATFVGSNGLIQSATADTQRIDYSIGTAGLLVEESRTNLITYSEDFSTGWQNVRSSVDSNVAIAPDGLQTADKIVEDTSTGSHYQNSVYAVSAVLPTTSIFLKAAERTQAWVRVARDNGVGNASGSLVVDLSSGTIIVGTGFIQPVGNSGWYRVWLTANTTATTNYAIRVGPVLDGNISYEGDGSSGIYAWGGQLEAAAFPTSYIPTELLPVTRNADVASMTGTNFSDWFNASEGTFAAESLTNDTLSTSNPHVLVAYADANNRITMQYLSSERFLSWVRLASVGSTSTISSVPRGVRHNATYGYKTSDSGGSLDGNAAVLSSPQPTGIPALNSLTIGHYAVGPASFLNGYLRKIYYWPQRLTNAVIQAFSK
jgi:hypothetical protein